MSSYVADHELCRSCKYRAGLGSNLLACSYIEIEKKSRIYDSFGVRLVEKGYCNNYSEGDAIKVFNYETWEREL